MGKRSVSARSAEPRLREIRADTEAVWSERRELLDDIGGMASSLLDAATAAAGRFPREESAEPEEELRGPEAEAETEPAAIPTDESAPAMPALGSDEGGDDESRDQVAQGTASGPDT
jgi:hypothetical protein